ncbi:SDR family NAD(P)-dependent oxidoreductase [Kangiella sp. HZ709]|uniref:SDR family NAD(P)-dependent oxidoreductase n=1 Tax=Kangiella sp. HZ709 TaxID=2666328 RepID=UPI0012B04D3F|nr:SDR family NAD(P)-dependent oxidoreductase [Kangiella sp. HZ709]MRX27213.1 SDR family NAD(P)-dependent oxidoreductase [Kangiella sp. HZ709]
MQKIILITGATDGIGFETAKLLVKTEHRIIIHGRSEDKLNQVRQELLTVEPKSSVDTCLCDLSDIQQVYDFASRIKSQYDSVDILINNAGILKTKNTLTKERIDIRFMVNTLAPYILTKQLLPVMPNDGRVINLSSAAQARVDLKALMGEGELTDIDAYAQSKLAITSWSNFMAKNLVNGPSIIAVNPGSLLGSKMVKEGFGVSGSNLSIGADILYRAALSEEFADATGKYYDNDSKQFSTPHTDSLEEAKQQQLITKMEELFTKLS